MAKCGIKVKATLSAGGQLEINTVMTGDANGLQKGATASYTYSQGGGNLWHARGAFVSVQIDLYQGNYRAKPSHNLQPLIGCANDIVPGIAPPNKASKRGQIVVKNPDEIVENPVSGTGYQTAVLSNSAADGDFVDYEIDEVTGAAKVLGIVTCP